MATVSTWFDERTCERIDELAAELSAVTGLDVTRSDIVKRAVKEFLNTRWKQTHKYANAYLCNRR